MGCTCPFGDRFSRLVWIREGMVDGIEQAWEGARWGQANQGWAGTGLGRRPRSDVPQGHGPPPEGRLGLVAAWLGSGGLG